STLIASSEKAKRVLGWQPEVTEVKDIIATAWQWHVKYPQGYNE
ncbi:TPA: UDP-glucose 4-epimerase, partial [Enterococcus faecalis]|nr:UDP-glucose 4-epimerase [Enterococcus faecalis]